MKFLGLDIPVKNIPELDEGFVPLGQFFKTYLANAKKPICVAVERSEGQIATWLTNIYGTPEMQEADAYYVDRLVKFLLWSKGGFKVTICGDETVANSVDSISFSEPFEFSQKHAVRHIFYHFFFNENIGTSDFIM
ncbi:MAG: hypothetical protein RR754_08325, partial [Oscillospiraceae bacterium]